MARRKKKPVEKVSAETVKCFRSVTRGRDVTLKPPDAYPDSWYVRVTKVNADGTFSGVLHRSVTCM
jgi:hypothetical protein